MKTKESYYRLDKNNRIVRKTRINKVDNPDGSWFLVHQYMDDNCEWVDTKSLGHLFLIPPVDKRKLKIT